MRRLTASTPTSLDGCFEGPGRDLTVLPFDGGFDEHDLELLEGATTHLFGRRFFEGSEACWAAVAEDRSQPPVQRRWSVRRCSAAARSRAAAGRPCRRG